MWPTTVLFFFIPNPGDMSTVFTTVKKCLDITNSIGQDHAVQKVDHQLYATAQQVKWDLLTTFDCHVLRMG